MIPRYVEHNYYTLHLTSFTRVHLYIFLVVPEPVQIISITPYETHVTLTWDVPLSSRPQEYFIIGYSLHQQIACSSPETNVQQMVVTTNGTNFTLEGLEPYSTYNVSLFSVNDAGQSEVVEVTVDTPEAGDGWKYDFRLLDHNNSFDLLQLNPVIYSHLLYHLRIT